MARFAPGNSPGTLNAGSTTFAGGGAFEFELNNAIGSVGTNYDLLAITGSLTIGATSGNPFGIDVTSLTLANTAGLAANFDSTADYSFTFLTTTGGIGGFSVDKFALDTFGFANPFSGTWSVALANGGYDLALTYTGASAIPEPSTYAAWAGGAMLVFAAWRRRRQRA